jgi:shikimate dehydrogenase
MNAALPPSNLVPVVNGRTLIFPVIGHPVAQVKAPMVLNALFLGAGVDALVVPLDLPPETVVETCRMLLASPSIGGLLVTVPYKRTLFELVDQPGEAAQLVGAVNALRRSAEGDILGDLFDGVGFLAGFRAAGHDPKGRRIMILGAGGAGSAIAAALKSANPGWIGIFDPDFAQASRLAGLLRSASASLPIEPLRSTSGVSCDVVINATPLGMKVSDALPVDPATFAADTLVVDVIMEPATTALLRRAAVRGLPTHPGRPMLDHQLPAYLDFFQLHSAIELARSSLKSGASTPRLP